MNDSLETLRGEVLARIQQANSDKEFEQLRVEVLGRSGSVTLLLRGLKDLPSDERPRAGEALNQLRRELEGRLDERLRTVKDSLKAEVLAAERIDITLPGTRWQRGSIHPLTLVIDEIADIFLGMGFEIARGPDIEDDYHNFEALNFPPDHPARDMQDTFFVANGKLLRTHTSPVQIRTMESRQPPLQVIVPGAVYRHDDDATHSPMFHQVEGFMVDEHITFADLKGTLTHVLRQIFERDTGVRFRPSFFPFTEPSAEVDVSCVFCKGSGCRVCKQSGWLEVAGAGLVHPEVFELCGWNPQKVQGWAFGMGIERLAMLKLGIPDLRLFFENRLTFLRGGS
jgi:phenylalanyl-tRNA synthetase alpha chain